MTNALRFARNSVAALALSAAVATAPASARPYYWGGGYHHYYRGGGIGLGGALLGAAIIGGIAVAASDHDRDYAPAYDGGPPPPVVYGTRGAPVDTAEAGPVGDCSRAAEDQAEHDSGGRARVSGIDRVDPIDGGANVLGYLEIDHGRQAPVDRIGFSCRAAYGRVTGIRLG